MFSLESSLNHSLLEIEKRIARHETEKEESTTAGIKEEVALKQAVEKASLDSGLSLEEKEPDENKGNLIYGSQGRTILESGYEQALLEYGPGIKYLETTLPFRGLKTEADEEEKDKRAQTKDTESETMTPEEARETIAEIQYATAMGSIYEVDSRTRERLNIYALFESSAFWLVERLQRVTGDVDYSKTI